MRAFATFLLLGGLFTSCAKPETVTPESLTGVWVEKTTRKDTLIFNPTFRGEILKNKLFVNRGKELNAGGYLVPKLGSGPYNYQLQGDRIAVISMYSSYNVKGSSYALTRQGNELQIGNFFELGFDQPATATRTLVRL